MYTRGPWCSLHTIGAQITHFPSSSHKIIFPSRCYRCLTPLFDPAVQILFRKMRSPDHCLVPSYPPPTVQTSQQYTQDQGCDIELLGCLLDLYKRSFVINNKTLYKSSKHPGYWHQRADERHGNPPQGNQELLVVRDKVGRPQVSLG